MRRPKKEDFVRSLMTGRWVQEKNEEGKVVEVFKPQRENEHLPLEKLSRLNPDMDGDALLVSQGLRAPKLQIDRELFCKNKKVKHFLKYLKKLNKREVRKAGFDPKKRLNASEPMTLRK